MASSAWFEELESLEKVVEVFELLGGKSEPRVATLVTPYRRFVLGRDVELREAPFSSTSKMPARCFLFKDLLILARTHGQIARKATMGDSGGGGGGAAAAVAARRTTNATSVVSVASSGNGDGFSKRRSFRMSFSKKKAPAANSNAQISTFAQVPLSPGMDVLTQDDAKAKLAHWFPLLECTFKPIHRPPAGSEDAANPSSGFQITHVTREQRPALDPGSGQEVMKSVTRVSKFELWFPTEQERDDMLNLVSGLAQDCQEKVASSSAAEAGSSNGGGSSTEPKLRSWAKNKKSVRLASMSRSGGDGDSVVTTSPGGDAPLSLQDLEKRYNVDFAPPASLDKVSVFTVEFGEGPMGLSLSSGPGVGVIVAKLATDGFAEVSGVMIGDRVNSVNGVEVDLNTTWQRCVEMLHAAGRPVTLAFVRNAVTSERIEHIMDERPSSSDQAPSPRLAATSPAAAAAATTTTTTTTIPAASLAPPAGGGGTAQAGVIADKPSKRRWARNRDVTNNGGLISLQEVEKMYRATGGGDLLVDVPETPLEHAESMDEAAINDLVLNSSTDSANNNNYGSGGVARTTSSLSVDTSGKRDGRAVLCDYIEKCPNEGERLCLGLLLEILETERNYVADLRALVKDYIVPLRRATKRCRCKEKEEGSLLCEHGSLRATCAKPSSESGPLLSADDVRVIFMNTETLVQINYELLVGLMDGVDAVAQTNPPPQEVLFKCVGVFVFAFTRIQPLLSMYALYCHQYAAATERLQQVRSREPEVDDFLRKREARSTQTSLRSLLIKPVQRICRYPLLFEELLKKMRKLPPGNGTLMSQCLRDIEFAAEALTRAGAEINKKVEDQDANQRMLEVFHELGGREGGDKIASGLITPSRRFIRSEEVFFRSAPFDTEAVPVKMYLFNDLILVAEEKDADAVGGGPLGLRNTLKKSRSRGKSLSQLIGLSKSRSNTMEGAGGGVGGPVDESLRALWTMRMTTWIDLQSCQVRPLEKPDEAGWWGFQIKAVERSVVGEQADASSSSSASATLTQRKSTKNIAAAAAAAAPDAGRIVTSILKFQVWKASKEEVDKLMTDMEDQIGLLEIRQQNAEIGAQLFGAGAGQGPRRTRSWAAKKRTPTPGMGGGSVSSQAGVGTVDATKEALEARYLGGGGRG